MGHFVTGIITNKSEAESIAAQIPFKLFYDLNQNFVIFPLTDELIDKHIPSPQNFNIEQFTYLSEELADILSQASSGKSIAYIETEYFGGEGNQSAIVFENGKVIFGPKQADIGPISEALKKIGAIKKHGDRDEFESIGLAGFRSCEDLLDNE